MNTIDYITTITSIIAIIISAIALYQTKTQIELSNKQHLFDRRIEKCLLIKELMSLYKVNRKYIVDNKMIGEKVDCHFRGLTNCSYLFDMNNVMLKPFETEARISFLSKCEKLKQDAFEIKFLWNIQNSELITTFILDYTELLRMMYQQQMVITNLHAEKEQGIPIQLEILQEKSKQVAEQIGLFDQIRKIEQTYNALLKSQIEQELFESIQLVHNKHGHNQN